MWKNKGSLLLFLSLLAMSTALLADVDNRRQQALIYMLKHDCGSCHGMRLAGGLGPALKPEQLQHWSVDQLAITILHGRPGTPMPPWRPFLTEQEARWLAGQLKQGIAP